MENSKKNSLTENDYKILTKGTPEEWKNAITDEYGVQYSPDGKKLLSTPVGLVAYEVKEGTESICESAFQYKIDLGVVILPSSVKYIGRCAFVHCERMVNCHIPFNVEYIGEMAFLCCHLFTVRIPNRVRKIENSCFAGNRELEKLILHDDIEEIGSSAFSHCKSLSHFSFPPKVKIIEKEVLYDCWNITEVYLPEGVTKIGSSAFSGTGIGKINFPSTLEEIDDYAFYECRNYKQIVIPNSIPHVSQRALKQSVWY